MPAADVAAIRVCAAGTSDGQCTVLIGPEVKSEFCIRHRAPEVRVRGPRGPKCEFCKKQPPTDGRYCSDLCRERGAYLAARKQATG